MGHKTIKFKEWNCTLVFGLYANCQQGMRLYEVETGEPVITASLCLPGCPLEKGQIFIKNYSENEGILDVLVKEGIVEPIDQVDLGFVKADRCKLLIEIPE